MGSERSTNERVGGELDSAPSPSFQGSDWSNGPSPRRLPKAFWSGRGQRFFVVGVASCQREWAWRAATVVGVTSNQLEWAWLAPRCPALVPAPPRSSFLSSSLAPSRALWVWSRALAGLSALHARGAPQCSWDGAAGCRWRPESARAQPG